MTNNIANITFNVTIYFQNGVTIQREIPLNKAAKLSMKENVIIDSDTELIEVHGINQNLIIPLSMTFVVSKAPEFRHIDKVSRYALYKRDGGRCAYCLKPLGQKESTIDHIVPKSQGGENIWENVCLACKECNCKKDNKTPEQAGMTLHVKPYNPKKRNSN